MSPSTQFRCLILIVLAAGSDTAEAPLAPITPQADEVSANALTFISIQTGGWHTCGITPNGALYCWGLNSSGQLGIGTNTGPELCSFSACSDTPVSIWADSAFSAVTAGALHACAISSNGGVYCWGSNESGQIGSGSAVGPDSCGGLACSTDPNLVARNQPQLSAGYSTNCLSPGSSAFCWGNNNQGQLGNGSTTGPDRCGSVPPSSACSVRPERVAGDRILNYVDPGSDHTCALTSSGVASCWGANSVGQLGIGTTGAALPFPVRVKGNLRFTALSTGISHNCAIADGHVYCWGSNSNGQLGDGTTTNRSTPVLISSSLTFSAVHTSGSHTCGEADGVVYCWGSNVLGALGDGTTTDRWTPVAVQTPVALTQVSTGIGHTCALAADTSAAYCWGNNDSGQLGIGNATGPDHCGPLAVPCARAPQPVVDPSSTTTLARSYAFKLRGDVFSRR